MRSKRLSLFLLLAPSLLFVLVFFCGGLIFGLLQSLGYFNIFNTDEGLTLAFYRAVLTDNGFARSLGVTLCITFISTLLSIFGGIATALLLRKNQFIAKTTVLLYQMPISVPHLIIAIGMISIISQSGILARVLYATGLIQSTVDAPILIYDSWGIGIILVYIWKQIPFIGLIVIATMQSIGNDYEEVARTLGATWWQTFRNVLLPLIIPAILPASIIIFAFVFGAFEVPFLLGKSFPSMLSVLAYRLYIDTNIDSRSQAMVLNIFIATTVLILAIIYRAIAKRLIRRLP